MMDQRSLHTVSENGEDGNHGMGSNVKNPGDLDHIDSNGNQTDIDNEMIKSYLSDVLEENIDRGDIPTAVTIIVMLKEYIGRILSEEDIVDVVLSYLELLMSAGALIEAVNVFEATKHNDLVQHYFLKKADGEKHRLIAQCPRHKEVLKSYQCLKCGLKPKCNGCGEVLLDKDALRRLKLKHC